MKENLSVHKIAKDCASARLFAPIKGKSGRESFTQVNVYKALFNDVYDAHTAKSDVIALVKIYRKLLQLKNENTDLLTTIS